MHKNSLSQPSALRRWASAGLLLLTAAIWGLAFVAQTKGMDYLQPLTFNGVRSLITGAVLLPAWALLGKKQPVCGYQPKALLGGGTLCGIALFFGSALQQIALLDTSAGKAGFLTALYIVLVPLLGLLGHRKLSGKVWLAVLLAAAGFYLLCGTGSLQLTQGELCLLGSAFSFAGQILLVDCFVERTNPMLLCCVQFTVCGVLSMAGAFLWEQPSLAGIWQAAVPLLYASVLSGAVGYTLQIVGQRDTPPAIASLLMSMESVFATVFGALLLHQQLSPAELAGCALVFVAVVLAQL